MNKKTLGILAVGQIAARATQDYVSPTVAGYIPAVAGLSGLTITNALLGVGGLYVAGMKKVKDNTKLGAAVLGSRLLTDVAYDFVKGYIPTTTPTGRYSRPMRAVASPSYGGGLVTVD